MNSKKCYVYKLVIKKKSIRLQLLCIYQNKKDLQTNKISNNNNSHR